MGDRIWLARQTVCVTLCQASAGKKSGAEQPTERAGAGEKKLRMTISATENSFQSPLAPSSDFVLLGCRSLSEQSHRREKVTKWLRGSFLAAQI